MDDRLIRIRRVFKESGMTQTELATMMDVSPQYIWKILNVDCNASDRMILSVIKCFPKINEIWLKTGEGNMYASASREAYIADMMAKLYKEPEDSYKFRFQKLLMDMNEEELEKWYNMAVQIVEAGKDLSD